MFGRKMTHCLDCGKRFNINDGAYLVTKPDGYICKMCHEKREKETRRKETGTTQSDTVLYVKILIGLCVIAGGVIWEPDEFKWNIGIYILCAVIGCALIAWAVVPYYQGKKVVEDERLQEILSKPLDTFGDLEIRNLSKKYDEVDGDDSELEVIGESEFLQSAPKRKKSISEYTSAARNMEKK